MNTELSQISGLVDKMMDERAEIARLEYQLAIVQARQRDLEEIQIPSLMESVGVTEIMTTSGLKVSLEISPKASITEANRDEAMQWLEDNGHGGLIKRTITVAFNRDQEESARQLLEEIAPKYAGVKEKKEVHSATLGAFVRSQVDEGAALPMDLFSVHFVKRVKVGPNGRGT